MRSRFSAMPSNKGSFILHTELETTDNINIILHSTAANEKKEEEEENRSEAYVLYHVPSKN